MSARLMHWNVFEDGLADTPASVSFSDAFSGRFTKLLAILSEGKAGEGAGTTFCGFAKSRDFSELPEAVPINSTAAFFGFIDIVYTLVYHVIGGDANLSDEDMPLEYAARKGVIEARTAAARVWPVGGTLRSLFLQSSLEVPDAPPRDAPQNHWQADTFEYQLGLLRRAAGGASPQHTETAAALSAVKADAFDPLTGSLSWSASAGRRLWKRETLALSKWMGLDPNARQDVRGLQTFISHSAASPSTSGLSAAAAAALARLCRVGSIGGPTKALLEVELDEVSGGLARLRTPTFQASVRWLLSEMLHHARANPRMREAIAEFKGEPPAAGWGTKGADPEAEHEALVGSIFAPLLSEMKAWTEAASLARRHAVVHSKVASLAPDIVTLVEFDEQWRAMPWPEGGVRYALTSGLGTASVLYNTDAFEPAALPGMEVPRKIRTAIERGDYTVPADSGSGDASRGSRGGASSLEAILAHAAPKNSCVILLRRRGSGELFLVVAVHLESGPPSDTKKVVWRAAQVRALLVECAEWTAQLASRGERVIVVVGGDFNALREEFVHGNTPAFFDSPLVAAVTPKLKRPPPTTATLAMPPDPTIATLGESGQLMLRCAACDGGWLSEASSTPAPPAPAVEDGCAALNALGDVGGVCTRAGSSMTIDFVLIGSVGCALQAATPRQMVPVADAEAAANPADGIRHAVTHWGSDHLPVAADVEINVPQQLD